MEKSNTCPSCGNENPPFVTKYCVKCGAALPYVVQPQRRKRQISTLGIGVIVFLILFFGLGVVGILVTEMQSSSSNGVTGTEACPMLTQQPTVTPLIQGYNTAISAKTDLDTYAPNQQIIVTGGLETPMGTPVVNQAIHIIIIGTSQTTVVRTDSGGSFSGELFAPSNPSTYTMVVQFPGTDLYAASCMTLVFAVSA